MELSHTSDSVTIGKGRMILKGREFAVIGEGEIVEIDSYTTGTLYCSLIAEIDLTKESTKSNFEQVTFKVLSSASNYPALTQQDINSGNASDTLYQYELARFRLTSSGITEFVDKRSFLNLDGIYADYQKRIQQINEGSAYVLNEVTTFNFNKDRVSGTITKQGRIAVMEFTVAEGSGMNYSTQIELPDAYRPLQEQIIQYFVDFEDTTKKEVEFQGRATISKHRVLDTDPAIMSFAFTNEANSFKGTLTYITAEPESTE